MGIINNHLIIIYILFKFIFSQFSAQEVGFHCQEIEECRIMTRNKLDNKRRKLIVHTTYRLIFVCILAILYIKHGK